MLTAAEVRKKERRENELRVAMQEEKYRAEAA